MRRNIFLARQAACPTGLLGRLLGRVMAVETTTENEIAVRLLELAPTDRVLEIGFGHGRTIALAAARVSEGIVAGIDLSHDMLRTASRFNRRLMRSGRVELMQSSADHIPYSDRSFEKVFSVHTIYFWSDPEEYLREACRVLKEGGRFVLGFRFDEAAKEKYPRPVYTFHSPDVVVSCLSKAGFADVKVEERQLAARRMYWAIARAPEST